MVATVVLINALGGGWLGVPARSAADSNGGAPASKALSQPVMAKEMMK
jgi:hypothetical protein